MNANAVAGSLPRLTSGAARIGFWGGLLTAVATVGFDAGAFGSLLLFPRSAWNGDTSLYAAAFTPWPMILTVVPSLLVAPGFIALLAAVHLWSPPRQRHLSLLAFGGALVYSVMVLTNYYLQLSLVRPSLETGHADRVALLIMDDPNSAFWSIELLAYGIQGTAAGIAAFVFAGPGLERAIRWSFALMGLSGILSLVAGVRGMNYADPVFIAGGALWGIALPAGAIFCAVLFRRTTSNA